MTATVGMRAGPDAAEPAPAAEAEADDWDPPRWTSPLLMALSVVGLGIAAYLTVAHYVTGAVLACPDTGSINCEKVTTSPQSVILGVPVALIGLLFFAAMTVLNSPACWRGVSPLLRWSRIGLASSGVVFALYLIYTELFTVHAICLWCTGAHIVAFLTLVAILSADGLARPVTRPAISH